MTSDSIDRLIAEQACRDLVLRSAQLTDVQDHAAFAGLFTPNGVLQRPGAAPLEGREAIVVSYTSRPPGRMTRHLVTNSVVNLVSATQAIALSYVLLWSGDVSAESGPFGRPAHARQVVGEFADTFELTAEGWRISSREARFVLHRESSA